MSLLKSLSVSVGSSNLKHKLIKLICNGVCEVLHKFHTEQCTYLMHCFILKIRETILRCQVGFDIDFKIRHVGAFCL